jgi:hypothetical protein
MIRRLRRPQVINLVALHVSTVFATLNDMRGAAEARVAPPILFVP